MNETSKAMRRRLCEQARGEFDWDLVLRGTAIDVGAGDDPLRIPENVLPFDKAQGDANKLGDYFTARKFDLIHASHVLEHLHDPVKSLLDWITLVKPNGHIVIEVPSWELYEGCRETSIWNPDHKSTWSMFNLTGGKTLPHYEATLFLMNVAKACPRKIKVLRCKQLTCNYDWIKGASVDQSFTEDLGVEPWIEMVIQIGK